MINDYTEGVLRIVHAAMPDVDFQRQAEIESEIAKANDVSCSKKGRKAFEDKYRKQPKKQPKVAPDYNLAQNGVQPSLMRVHAEHPAGITPYVSPPKRPWSKISNAKPKTKLRTK